MGILNDFEKMCLHLKRMNKKSKANEVVLARNELKKYIAGDKNRLLKIKAESSTSNYQAFCSELISISALLISLLSLMEKTNFINIIISIVLLFILFVFHIMRKLSFVGKWKGYIVVVIKELEK